MKQLLLIILLSTAIFAQTGKSNLTQQQKDSVQSMLDLSEDAIFQTIENRNLEISIIEFGAVADANYFNKSDDRWYSDAGFTTLSTDNADAIDDAINKANSINGTLFIPFGNFYIDRGITVIDCDLKSEGTLVLPSHKAFDTALNFRGNRSETRTSYAKYEGTYTTTELDLDILFDIDELKKYSTYVNFVDKDTMKNKIISIYTNSGIYNQEGLFKVVRKTGDIFPETMYDFGNIHRLINSSGDTVNSYTELDWWSADSVYGIGSFVKDSVLISGVWHIMAYTNQHLTTGAGQERIAVEPSSGASWTVVRIDASGNPSDLIANTVWSACYSTVTVYEHKKKQNITGLKTFVHPPSVTSRFNINTLMYISDVHNLTIRDMRHYGAYSRVDINNCFGLIIENTLQNHDIVGTAGSNDYNLAINNCADVIIQNCDFSSGEYAPFQGNHNNYVRVIGGKLTGGLRNSSNLTFDGVTFVGNGATGGGGRNLKVLNCTFYSDGYLGWGRTGGMTGEIIFENITIFYDHEWDSSTLNIEPYIVTSELYRYNRRDDEYITNLVFRNIHYEIGEDITPTTVNLVRTNIDNSYVAGSRTLIGIYKRHVRNILIDNITVSRKEFSLTPVEVAFNVPMLLGNDVNVTIKNINGWEQVTPILRYAPYDETNRNVFVDSLKFSYQADVIIDNVDNLNFSVSPNFINKMSISNSKLKGTLYSQYEEFIDAVGSVKAITTFNEYTAMIDSLYTNDWFYHFPVFVNNCEFDSVVTEHAGKLLPFNLGGGVPLLKANPPSGALFILKDSYLKNPFLLSSELVFNYSQIAFAKDNYADLNDHSLYGFTEPFAGYNQLFKHNEEHTPLTMITDSTDYMYFLLSGLRGRYLVDWGDGEILDTFFIKGMGWTGTAYSSYMDTLRHSYSDSARYTIRIYNHPLIATIVADSNKIGSITGLDNMPHLWRLHLSIANVNKNHPTKALSDYMSSKMLYSLNMVNSNVAGELYDLSKYEYLYTVDLRFNQITTYTGGEAPVALIRLNLGTNALTQEAVDRILWAFANNTAGRPTGSAQYIYLQGGSNAAPSAQGIIYKNKIINDLGWIVNTN